jgi:hypothetical protein
MDNRFVHPSYTKSMPADWLDVDARELVSNSILREVAEFWAGEPQPDLLDKANAEEATPAVTR